MIFKVSSKEALNERIENTMKNADGIIQRTNEQWETEGLTSKKYREEINIIKVIVVYC